MGEVKVPMASSPIRLRHLNLTIHDRPHAFTAGCHLTIPQFVADTIEVGIECILRITVAEISSHNARAILA